MQHNNNLQFHPGPETLIPPTDSLIGKVIAFHCSYQDQSDLEILSCAKIQEYSEATPSPSDPDGAIQYSLMVISMIISTAIAYL